jgi:catechol 2,3-dioxygenase-like lactoylglutathione lyase family enzyme
MKTTAINHPAMAALDLDETIHFYQDILGMEMVLRQPNLDDPNSTHLFFHVGNDNFLAFFAPNEKGAWGRSAPRGALMHIAMDVDKDSFSEALTRLKEAGIDYTGPIDRGYERSIYFRDPNGILLEFLTWITPLPQGVTQAEVLARAQRIREAEGAYNIEDRHIRKALTEMGHHDYAPT